MVSGCEGDCLAHPVARRKARRRRQTTKDNKMMMATAVVTMTGADIFWTIMATTLVVKVTAHRTRAVRVCESPRSMSR